jgi:cell division protein ZapA (FtsZ GTPase activity inhibitor)
MFRTICSIHDTITLNSNEILKVINLFDSKIDSNKAQFGITIEEIDSLISDIRVCLVPAILLDVSEAKEAGQRMEDKLRERKTENLELIQTIEEQEDRISNLESELEYYKLHYPN